MNKGQPISAAYLERKLRALLGVQGQNPIPELEDIKGLIVLEGDRPEWAFAGGEQLLQNYQAIPAAPGEFSYLAFTNPVGSGVLGIFEEFRSMLNGAVATNPFSIFYDASTTALQGVLSTSSGNPRDLRMIPAAGTLSLGAIIVQTGNDPAPSATASRINPVLAGASVGVVSDSYKGPIILPEGRRILLLAETVNTVIAGGASWRERPIEGKFELK